MVTLLFYDKTISKEFNLDITAFLLLLNYGQNIKFQDIDSNNEKAITQDYFIESSSYELRYYQQIAINKSIENIVNNKKQRLLLVMATGTRKTQVAFQIIYRLWKANIKKEYYFLLIELL